MTMYDTKDGNKVHIYSNALMSKIQMTLNGHMSNITTYTAEATTSEYRQEPNRTKSPEDKHPGP